MALKDWERNKEEPYFGYIKPKQRADYVHVNWDHDTKKVIWYTFTRDKIIYKGPSKSIAIKKAKAYMKSH